MKVALNISSIKSWLPNADEPYIISGPCSAETEQQVMDTATQIAATGKVNFLRAGIWKPRTRPDSFEGVGAIGLKWLRSAGEATGLKTITEVANAAHVEACLTAGIDVLWIGARTTVNPFSVQEIADALKGVDIPVMVKNPVNPDLHLWIGALERVNKAGINKLAAIHRGFSSHGKKSIYRNQPLWEIPIELKTLCPDLDIICDPSHITGDRELLFAISQKAIDLDMAGLMLEAHIDPDNALSDAKQQVTPKGLDDLLSQLVLRTRRSDNPEFMSVLEELRARIDELDADMLKLLADRMDIAEQIGQYKKENDVTVLQVERWEKIIRERMAQGLISGLSEEFMKHLLQSIHKESIARQVAIMNRELANR